MALHWLLVLIGPSLAVVAAFHTHAIDAGLKSGHWESLSWTWQRQAVYFDLCWCSVAVVVAFHTCATDTELKSGHWESCSLHLLSEWAELFQLPFETKEEPIAANWVKNSIKMQRLATYLNPKAMPSHSFLNSKSACPQILFYSEVCIQPNCLFRGSCMVGSFSSKGWGGWWCLGLLWTLICHASHADALEDVLTLSVSGVGVLDPGLVIQWWQGLLSSSMFKSWSTMQLSWWCHWGGGAENAIMGKPTKKHSASESQR